MRLLSLLVGVVALLWSQALAVPTDEAALREMSDPGRRCGRLAAYAPDPERLAPPVPADAFDAEAARRVCAEVLAERPADAGARFHLARAHWRLGDRTRAVRLLEQAAGLGHGGAAYVLGRLHQTGEAVARDHAEALRLYLEAARAGAFAGVAGALSIYADPESEQHDPAKAGLLARDPSAVWMRHRQAEAW